jgi:hypothetical protein
MGLKHDRFKTFLTFSNTEKVVPLTLPIKGENPIITQKQCHVTIVTCHYVEMLEKEKRKDNFCLT